jgi:hypothetical protein
MPFRTGQCLPERGKAFFKMWVLHYIFDIIRSIACCIPSISANPFSRP